MDVRRAEPDAPSAPLLSQLQLDDVHPFGLAAHQQCDFSHPRVGCKIKRLRIRQERGAFDIAPRNSKVTSTGVRMSLS